MACDNLEDIVGGVGFILGAIGNPAVATVDALERYFGRKRAQEIHVRLCVVERMNLVYGQRISQIERTLESMGLYKPTPKETTSPAKPRYGYSKETNDFFIDAAKKLWNGFFG